jgi:hypothetical protein
VRGRMARISCGGPGVSIVGRMTRMSCGTAGHSVAGWMTRIRYAPPLRPSPGRRASQPSANGGDDLAPRQNPSSPLCGYFWSVHIGLAPLDAILSDPVAQRALVDTLFTGHLGDRLPGLPHDPDRTLTELRIKFPSLLRNGSPLRPMPPRSGGKLNLPGHRRRPTRNPTLPRRHQPSNQPRPPA